MNLKKESFLIFEIGWSIIYLCILIEKYGQSKLDQNYTLSNESSIAEQREY